MERDEQDGLNRSQGESSNDGAIFVYRCSGDVDEIRPATGVRLTSTAVVVLFGDRPIATYQRSDVYFAATCEVPPAMY